MDIDNIMIRNASIEDIEQIVEIKVNGWKNAYDGIVDTSYLNTMSLDEQINKYKNYSLKDIFVAELDSQIVGFCRIYDYDSLQYDIDIDCEIREIYVRPDLKRMGIGSKLFVYVLDYFKSKNKNKLYLGVFEDNYRSRNFYEKMGGILWKNGFLEIDEKRYSTVSYIYNLKE